MRKRLPVPRRASLMRGSARTRKRSPQYAEQRLRGRRRGPTQTWAGARVCGSPQFARAFHTEALLTRASTRARKSRSVTVQARRRHAVEIAPRLPPRAIALRHAPRA